MNYHLLGKSGLRVSELSLGAMGFGDDVFGTDEKTSGDILNRYIDLGGNFIDTANIYAGGESEKTLGRLITPSMREDLVLGTKYSLAGWKGKAEGLLQSGNSRKSLINNVDKSLERLQTDYIDVFMIHAWDYTTPIEEVMSSLNDLVRSGKVLYLGASNTPAWVISRANAIAEKNGWEPFNVVQLTYNVADRAVEREYIPMAQELDLAITCAQPLAGGALTNPKEQEIRKGAQFLVENSERTNLVAQAVNEIAEETGYSVPQIALSWLTHRNGIVIPVAGARLPEHVSSNVEALSINLTPEQTEKINKAGELPLEQPYDVQVSQRYALYSNQYEDIKNHRHPELTEYIFSKTPWKDGR